MQSEPNTVQTPFQINVADRVKRLPPYLFGKINALKYRKRRAGIDVIDLGMGNPTDVPDPLVIEKLCEAAQRRAQPPLLRQQRPATTSAARWPCDTQRRHGVQLDPDTEVLAGLGSKEVFSHMCLALLGPGDTAVVPAPSFPIHVYAVALASGNVISLDCTQPDRFLSQRRHVAEHLYPAAQGADPELSAQPDDDRRSSATSSWTWWPWPASSASWSSTISPTATSASTATRPRAS